jgi:hypothetical protein
MQEHTTADGQGPERHHLPNVEGVSNRRRKPAQPVNINWQFTWPKGETGRGSPCRIVRFVGFSSRPSDYGVVFYLTNADECRPLLHGAAQTILPFPLVAASIVPASTITTHGYRRRPSLELLENRSLPEKSKSTI